MNCATERCKAVIAVSGKAPPARISSIVAALIDEVPALRAGAAYDKIAG